MISLDQRATGNVAQDRRIERRPAATVAPADDILWA
jgi:hypothetical protein